MKICEIFHSIQGESTYAGLPCTFIRTSGCNLRCSYCDTKYAYENGKNIPIDEIVSIVEFYHCKLVEITGGEPILQKDEVNELAKILLDQGYEILLETNGSLNLENLNPRIVKIMDLKCPDSGMSEYINWDNIHYLNEHDQVKFVLSSRMDYEWARDVITTCAHLHKIEILLSTAFDLLNPADVVKWMIDDRLKVRFQLQLHKYIWHPNTRGV
jgi:7-carboxy-7-deazaguanine synthase